MIGEFDNVYDAVMAQRSEQYIYAGRRFPEPPAPTCHECDELIPEDEYDDPMPSVCPDCQREYDESVPDETDMASHGRGALWTAPARPRTRRPYDPGEQADPDWATYV
jgi:hypothetical protein